MQKRTNELVPGDRILTEDLDSHGRREVQTVKSTFACHDHMRIITNEDPYGVCENTDYKWEVS